MQALDSVYKMNIIHSKLYSSTVLLNYEIF